MTKIEGLIAAVFTPFRENGTINREMIPVIVNKLLNDGVRGIFVLGSNGEGPNLSREERMLVAEEFVKAAEKRLLIIIHVGHSSIAEARLLAEHAESVGADAFSAVAAFYFKPVSVRNLVQAMSEIAGAAPTLPFYYYHIPRLTGVSMDMVEFLCLGKAEIPNLAGIKYTAGSFDEYQLCLNYDNGHFDVLYGLDELLLPALSVGSKGAIGSTYSFAAPLFLDTIRAFRSGDLAGAQNRHLYLVKMITTFLKYPPIPAQRAIMKMLGFDFGPSRLPLVDLNHEDYQRLEGDLKKISFFEKIAALQTP